jgi:PTH1 family peptidyl-tRNA hydrolase
MKLIAGLGNPGPQYEQTPHNAGFWLIDALSEAWRCEVGSEKFQAMMGRNGSGDQSVILMKPLTFMNHSGQAVAACARFYKIDPSDIVICTDDLDLVPGKARLRSGGGHGGHNGLRSVIEHLNSDSFRRVRLGIGRPPADVPTVDYVLRRWSQEARQQCQTLIRQVFPLLEKFISGANFPQTSLNAPL